MEPVSTGKQFEMVISNLLLQHKGKLVVVTNGDTDPALRQPQNMIVVSRVSPYAANVIIPWFSMERMCFLDKSFWQM